MALQATVTYKGVDCTYLKVLTEKTLFLESRTVVYLGAYVSADARAQDAQNAITVLTHDLAGTDLTRAGIYAELKEKYYPDAEDV
jgi:hypothetical protein